MRRVMLSFVVTAFVPQLLFAQASAVPAGEDRSCGGSHASEAQVRANADELFRSGQLGAAACWYRLGVNAGDAKSQTSLGDLYRLGGRGLERNPNEAMDLYMLAIKQSYPKAFFGMAEILEAAGGINRDYADQLRTKGKQLEQLQAGHMGGARPGGAAARTTPAPGLIELPPEPSAADGRIAAPENFHAAKAGHSVNMSWRPVEGAMAYCVYRAPNGAEGPGPERVTCTSELAAIDTDAKPGTMYIYFVVAVDRSKESSDFSNMVTIR